MRPLFRLLAPTADSTSATTTSDSVGNKADAANETAGEASLIGLSRSIISRLATFGSAALATSADMATALAALVVIDGFHDIPAQDSAANSQMRDVVGGKTDTHDGDSLYARAHAVEEHLHTMPFVLPDLAAPITATAAVAAWTYGVESATLGTPSDAFDLHWIDIIANANDQYQARISVAGVPVSFVTFERVSPFSRSATIPVMMPITAAGAITVALASAAGSSAATFKVRGHTY